MNQQEWLSAVSDYLRRSGLPESYVRRTCSELADHADQCRSAGRRFNTLDDAPDELGRTLVVNYRRRSLIGRCPPVLCLLVPLLLAVGVPLAYFASVGATFEVVCEGLLESPVLSRIESVAVWTCFYFGIVSVPIISSTAVAWFVRQMARPWGWSLVMFGVLFWATFSIFTTLTFESDGPDLSLAVDLTRSYVGSVYHWGQCLTVAAIGLLTVLQQRNQQRRQRSELV